MVHHLPPRDKRVSIIPAFCSTSVSVACKCFHQTFPHLQIYH